MPKRLSGDWATRSPLREVALAERWGVAVADVFADPGLVAPESSRSGSPARS